MKKLAVILAFLMLVPGAAFGMEMMNDSSMDDVTGQAGVSIAFDDVELFLNIDRIAWLDADGLSTDPTNTASTTGSGGAVGIENFQIDTMKVNAIIGTDGDGDLSSDSLGGAGMALQYNDDGDGYDGTNAFDAINDGEVAALSIDATSALPVLSKGHGYNDSVTDETVGGVMIGLPTVEVNIPSMSLEPKFWALDTNAELTETGEVGTYNPTGSATVYNHATSFGEIEMTEITFTVLGGWMEIAPH